ncbi:MAG: ABC transporter permease [Nocardioides sp.]
MSGTLTSPVVATAPERPTFSRPPFARLVRVELRKTFDTRAGWWLCASVGILAVIATGVILAFVPDSDITYEAFASAVGFPMAIILPMLAILSVTSEWSQRSGLGTFTMVPHRGRVIRAKAAVAAIIGVVSMIIAMAVGAVGNVVGSAITGVDLVWDTSAADLASIVIANLLGMAIGFTLAVLLRNSAAAIVGYFVYSFVLTGLSAALAAYQDWWHDLQPWLDFNFAQGSLFEGWPTGEQWAQLGVSGVFWLAIPLAIGLRLVVRSEVK